jgi:hypothetical protein
MFNYDHEFANFLVRNIGLESKGNDLGKILNYSLDPMDYSYKSDSLISWQHEFLSCPEGKEFTWRARKKLSKEDFVMYPHGINF